MTSGSLTHGSSRHLQWEQSGPTWPCPASYSSQQGQSAEVSKRAGEGNGACLTLSNIFPVQLQTAKFPEKREMESSKTRCLQGPKAWEPKLRLRHRQARRQPLELENYMAERRPSPPEPSYLSCALDTLSPLTRRT